MNSPQKKICIGFSIFFIFSFSLITITPKAYACSSNPETPAQTFENHPTIFIGKVMKAKIAPSGQAKNDFITFKVSDILQGHVEQIVTAETYSSENNSCGRWFQVGESYVVIADEEGTQPLFLSIYSTEVNSDEGANIITYSQEQKQNTFQKYSPNFSWPLLWFTLESNIKTVTIISLLFITVVIFSIKKYLQHTSHKNHDRNKQKNPKNSH